MNNPSYHGFKYKDKWYLSPLCIHSEAVGLTFVDIPDFNKDDISAYTRLDLDLDKATARIKDRQEEDDEQAKHDAFIPTEVCVRGQVKAIGYLWYIHPERSFNHSSRGLRWPAVHKNVYAKELPRLYLNRKDAEFICDDIAKRHATCMGSEGDETWTLKIKRDEDQTTYLVTDPDDEDDVYALGWINRVELVK